MEKLKSLRKERNLTLEELAHVLGLTKQVLSRYERGEREADYKTLLKLAQYFDVSVDYLLGNSIYYYPDKVGAYPPQLSHDEREILELYSALSPTRKEDLKIYLRALSGADAQSAKKKA